MTRRKKIIKVEQIKIERLTLTRPTHLNKYYQNVQFRKQNDSRSKHLQICKNKMNKINKTLAYCYIFNWINFYLSFK